MDRRYFALGALGLGLVACAPINSARLGPDGLPLPQVYRITEADRDAVMLRMLDAVNSLRKAAGRGPVALNAQLNAAAATHARDMAVQNRPWHFGSDGSSPLDRLRRVGYSGQLRGEAISESYETELETLAAWMQQPDTRDVILDRGEPDGICLVPGTDGQAVVEPDPGRQPRPGSCAAGQPGADPVTVRPGSRSGSRCGPWHRYPRSRGW